MTKEVTPGKSKKRSIETDDVVATKVTRNSDAVKNAKAFPLSDDSLSQELLDLIDIACKNKLVKKGANETTKAVNRGRAGFIVLAADTTPFEIVLHLPLLCEDKNIPYVFAPSRIALGRACGLSRPVIACAVLSSDNSTIQPKVQTMISKLERLVM